LQSDLEARLKGSTMSDFPKQFRIDPGTRVRLKAFETGYVDPHATRKHAEAELEALRQRLGELQYGLYAEKKRSLLICLQAPDAGGKDGVVRHVLSSMNPLGCRAVSFKQPSTEEGAHDFLWRIERQCPGRGEVAIFNRSHYEDVLIVRVHELVPKQVWSKRYEQINAFESRLAAAGTHILKFFLHISKDEQLQRFGRRLEDPTRQWKISEADYQERKAWGDYQDAYEEAFSQCSTDVAPWYVIPSDHKWFRDLAIARILVEALEKLAIELPKASVDLADIRRKYHAEAKGDG
jgi:PPK2 family polyphosphate:nucleotide phosphotransferase